jgi:hypothetical protein
MNPNWAVLVQRLPTSGLLKDDPEMMRRILEQIQIDHFNEKPGEPFSGSPGFVLLL